MIKSKINNFWVLMNFFNYIHKHSNRNWNAESWLSRLFVNFYTLSLRIVLYRTSHILHHSLHHYSIPNLNFSGKRLKKYYHCGYHLPNHPIQCDLTGAGIHLCPQEASRQVSYRARVSDQPPTLSQQSTSNHSTLTIPSSNSLMTHTLSSLPLKPVLGLPRSTIL